MMNKKFWAFTLLLCFAGLAFTQANIEFYKANELYKNGQYDSAVLGYERILKTDIESSELYFNLGNSYFKSKQNAKAILNYEKAMKLNPNDEAISFNLELANSLLVDKITVLPEFFLKKWFKNIVNIYSSDDWALFSIVTFISTLLLLLLFFFARIMILKKISFWVALITLVLSVSTFYLSYKQKQQIVLERYAIVMTSSVTVKSSPDEAGTDLFVIHDGLKVEVIDQVGEWRNIKLADGNKGWLKLSDIEFI